MLDEALSTPELTDAVTRISGMPAADRVRRPRSLGEIMVLAHASVYAQTGHAVFVLIDESDGRARAAREQAWLRRRGVPGSLVLWSTAQVLGHAAGQPGWIKGGLTWTAVYDRMREYDDGLPPRPS